ncbi:MAG TPA: Gfo/Idh/MocA family oxidoreductase [Vicinamibacterales bacterium]|jgi:predicted dehydrogenase
MPLRWGILGTARINRMLIPAIRASNRSMIAGVASRARGRADRYAAEWDIPRVFESYAALLDDPAMDVVYIPLPNSLHVEWTIRALDAGKHVLCEKPLALSIEDVDRIEDAAARARRVAAEAFMYRHHPITMEAQRLVAAGALGPLETIHGAFTFALTRSGDVRLDPSLGGGSLWDVGCYPVSYACLLAGHAAEAFGWAEMAGGVDLAFHGMLRFPSDVVAQFDCGFRGPFRAAIDIVGRDASLTIERPFRTDERSCLALRRGDVVEHLPFEAAPAFTGEIDDMECAALGERAPRVSLAESRRTASAITALYESARSGRVVQVGGR